VADLTWQERLEQQRAEQAIKLEAEFDQARLEHQGLIGRQIELIAKAVGIHEDDLMIAKGGGVWAYGLKWSPRRVSGDAFGVLTALKMNIEHASGSVYAQHRTADGFWINSPSIQVKGRDLDDVYREAICACAIKVGERLP